MNKNKLKWFLGILLVLLIGFVFFAKDKTPVQRYSEGYSLVAEKVSQSAPIKIYLPQGVNKETAKQAISFEPEIQGEWVDNQKQSFLRKVFASEENEYLLFKPNEKLDLNKSYLLKLDLGENKVLQAFFMSVEDPEIIRIIPEEGTEAPTQSKITIIFNRPMVPLTTLDEMEKQNFPIEIYPKTQGKFKWISTNTLQFIPEDGLLPSSNYRVKIKQGFVSMDGLSVSPKETHFTSLNLRYLSEYNFISNVLYNEPIRLYFNQPVDLEKTSKEITLFRGKDKIDFISKYNEEDKRIIEIYNKKDRFNRKEFWDFSEDYSILIKKAYPALGDIIIDKERTISFNTTSIVKSYEAISPRTTQVSQSLFDPKGELVINFYEDIDIIKSKIVSSFGITSIKYGEKCKDDWPRLGDYGCEVVEDKKKVIIKFNESSIKAGSVIDVHLKEVFNVEGIKLNGEEIYQPIYVYKPLKVNAFNENLNYITLCSNSPLLQPDEKDYREVLKTDLDYEFFSFGRSYFSDRGVCAGDMPYRTDLYVGLQPEKDYNMDFNIQDVFSNEVNFKKSFRTIEMGTFSVAAFPMQQTYSITPTTNTKLLFGTKNILYVDVLVCKMEATTFIDKSTLNYNYQFNINSCLEVKRKRIELPPKYWVNNFFEIDIKDFYDDPLGHYAIIMEHPLFSNYIPLTFLTVTNLAVGEKRITPSTYYDPLMDEKQLSTLQNMYFVTDMRTGEGVLSADVYYYGVDGVIKKGTTDDKGVAFTNPVFGLKGVIVRKGSDTTIIQGSESRLGYGASAYNAKKFYIYQDKPIYRPGEKVNIKGILRLGYDGDYESVFSDVPLTVRNSKWDEIFKKDLTPDKFGTISTDLILPDDSPLGNYAVCVLGSCSYFDVQEYVPAPFEVKLKADKEEYISKDMVEIEIDANYYFGVPVSNAEVSYTISSQNYYFDKFREEYFQFQDFDDYEDKFILRGETTLDSKGKGVIRERLEVDASKIIIVNVSVKNPMGQAVSSQFSFIMHQGEAYIGVNASPYFAGKNQEITLKFKSVDQNGKPQALRNIKAEAYKIDWVYARRQEVNGSYSYKWEKKRELVSQFEFNTDQNGNFSRKIKFSDPHSYEIDVFSEDSKGNKIKTRTNIYIFGEGFVQVRYTDKTELNLTAKETDLKVGDKGEIIIESPFKEAKAFIAIERGKVFEYDIVDVSQNMFNYKFDIKEEYYPNVFVSVLLQSKDEPQVKFGSQEFRVNSDTKQIEIEFKSLKDFYEPGDTVKLEILTKDSKQKPISASVSLAVVDLSVLALKGNPKKDPLVFFYNGFPLAVSTFSNLKSIIEVEDIQITKGGGGGDEDDSKARGEFKDTAFFEANIITDQNGRAEIEFKLPDNLTTWQAEALGVTEDTKLGVSYTTFQSKKDLMVVPLKPRFIIPGDEFYVGAQVFNQSDLDQTFKVKLKSKTLELLDKEEISVPISKQGSAKVYFKVRAPLQISEGFHSFELYADSKRLSDGVLQVIKINKNLTYETVATSAYTTSSKAFETIYIPTNVSTEQGELNIKSSATLAVFLSDGLNYLLGYPYGCAEQITSRLKAIAIIKKGLNIPNIEDKFNLKKVVYNNKEYTLDEVMQIGLSQIYTYQNYDGGYTFWKQGYYSDYYVTLSVVDALNYIKEAGYEVSQKAIDDGADYLLREYNNNYANSYKDTIMLAKVLLKVPKHKDNVTLKAKINEIANDDVLLKDRLSNRYLAELALIVNSGGFDATKVNNYIDNKINIDARGAFLDIEKDYAYYYFETAVLNTATYLNSIAEGERETAFNDKVLRWLLNSRDKDGAWGSTQNTLKVVEAFTNYLNWKKETEANYNLKIDLNQKNIQTYNFNEATILDQLSKTIEIKDLKKGDFNFLEFSKDNEGGLYYDASLKYYLEGGDIPPRDEGFAIVKGFYKLEDVKNENPILEAEAGDVFKVHIEIATPNTRKFVAIEDYIPAGLEIINLDLKTEDQSLIYVEKDIQHRVIYPDFKEIRDDRYFAYKDTLNPGVYEFDYYVRALVKGDYLMLPSHVSEMYTPENFGRTKSEQFTVK